MLLRRLALAFVILNTILIGFALAIGMASKSVIVAYNSSTDGLLTIKIALSDVNRSLYHHLEINQRKSYLPIWSPDGQQIAFYTYVFPSGGEGAGQRELYVMDWNGKNVELLASETAYETISFIERPAWSPDGQWIAFSTGSGGIGRLFVVKRDGSRLRQISDEPDISFPQWTPDGKFLIFDTYYDNGGHIFRSDLSGEIEQLTPTTMHSSGMPALSSDGNQIVFTSLPDNLTSEIYIMDIKGENLQRLTFDEHDDYHPSWSPDGQYILFATRLKYRSPILHVITTNGIEVLNFGQAGYWSSWSPDGEWIEFDAEGLIYVMRRDGSDKKQLRDRWGGEPEGLDWRP